MRIKILAKILGKRGDAVAVCRCKYTETKKQSQKQLDFRYNIMPISKPGFPLSIAYGLLKNNNTM